MSVYAVKIS